MNALVIIDTDALTPATVFAPGGVEGIISKLETDVRAIDRDISTPEGREAVKSLAYKVARSKTALDEMGKGLVAGIKAQAATIDAERRIIRERLDALRDEVRDPLTDWESRESARVCDHENALVWLATSDRFATPPTVAMIRAQLADVAGLSDRNWQEFGERADAAIADARAKLNAMLAATEQAERDAAELADLRRMKAEREEQDRIAAIAAQAAERARIYAEQAAEHQAKERAEQEERERIRAEQAEQWKKEAEVRAAKQAEEAAARAIEQERRRVAAEQEKRAAEKALEDAAERKRQENKRHRQKIANEIIGDLMNHTGNCSEVSHAVFEAIARGAIRHVSVTY